MTRIEKLDALDNLLEELEKLPTVSNHLIMIAMCLPPELKIVMANAIEKQVIKTEQQALDWIEAKKEELW